ISRNTSRRHRASRSASEVLLKVALGGVFMRLGRRCLCFALDSVVRRASRRSAWATRAFTRSVSEGVPVDDFRSEAFGELGIGLVRWRNQPCTDAGPSYQSNLGDGSSL